jgi:hypothetical protein
MVDFNILGWGKICTTKMIYQKFSSQKTMKS